MNNVWKFKSISVEEQTFIHLGMNYPALSLLALICKAIFERIECLYMQFIESKYRIYYLKFPGYFRRRPLWDSSIAQGYQWWYLLKFKTTFEVTTEGIAWDLRLHLRLPVMVSLEITFEVTSEGTAWDLRLYLKLLVRVPTVWDFRLCYQ